MRMAEITVKFKSIVKIALVGRLTNTVISRQQAEEIVNGFGICHVDNLCAVVCKFTKALFCRKWLRYLCPHGKICAGDNAI